MAEIKPSCDLGPISYLLEILVQEPGAGTEVTSGLELGLQRTMGGGAPNSSLKLGVPPTMPHSLPKPLKVDFISQQGIR